jgi:gluconate 2-dehydrogenase alpha chain
MMNAVGGTSIHYGMQSWRLSPWNFKGRSETIRRYGAGAIPAGSTLVDWPVDYEELEPYYDRVEFEIGVSGKAGNLNGTLVSGGNPFEGPRRREFPMPPLRRSGWTELMAAAARRLGWHPFPGPAAIASERYDGRPGCSYCGFCTTNGCHQDSKGSTFLNAIPAAEKTGNLTVIPNARVTEIAVDADGRASGVAYLRGGTSFFQPAKVVLLAGYTYENVRLLLLSRSAAYPAGLANNHSQVGRHFMAHGLRSASVTGLFPGRRLNRFSGTVGQWTAVDEWADDNFDHGDLDFIGGGNLWVYSDQRPIAAASMPTFGRAPRWGSDWKAFVMANADRWVNSYLQKTTLPYEDNYLDLHPTIKDPLGFPVCRITADHKDNEKRLAAFIQDKMEEWFRQAGAIATQRLAVGTMGVTTHAYGGTRMGDDPETNVVDRWGFAHEVPNLGILGASVMGTSGARNPTLTAQALAWRTAERLAADWSAIAG